MENDSVRYSRAGDVFHYRWAARRCLRMIYPKSSLRSIVIEGSKERKLAGEYVIDVAEYSVSAERNVQEIAYFQLKHTTVRKEQPFNLSDLKGTIEGFAERYSEHFIRKPQTDLPSVTFTIVTNRPISESFKHGVLIISKGEQLLNKDGKVNKQFQQTIEKYTKLNGHHLKEFCALIRFTDGEGDYNAQRYELHVEISQILAGTVDNPQIDHITTLVQEKALPESDGLIVREDILKRFGVTSERDLFPAPPEFEKMDNPIPREQHQQLLDCILSASSPIIIHAAGGVGKSVFAHQIVQSLPADSLGIIYDCFGGGRYRNRSELRHHHRHALVQIANELASKGLCDPLIAQTTASEEQIMRMFITRLRIAAMSLRKANETAILVVLIDAADNAEMAAKEFNQPCFVHELLREPLPDGCRLIGLCRTERIDLIQPSSTLLQLELESFSQEETLIHLRGHFADATVADGLEFQRLTNNGNPRVQANALSLELDTIAEILASLGPGGTTVDDQIAMQLDSAIANVKEKLSVDYQKSIDAICLGLATLPPFIPLSVLAKVAGVGEAMVKSFISDLGRPLWFSDTSVQFRDEPTETWFRERFAATVEQISAYVTCLKPLADKYSYVAESLPSLLLQAEKYNELIDLALSDDFLPHDNPIDARNVRIYRLQFAFKAALKLKRYTDATKLALRAGEEVAGDRRQYELLTKNVDLIAPLQNEQKVQELAFRRMLRSSWDGSENVYSASLLSFVKDFKGEARGYLRAARNWLKLYFEERNKSKEEFYQKRLKDEDIVELTFAYFNLFGASAAVDSILRWQPEEVIYRITLQFIKRLVDAGRFDVIDKIAHIGYQNQYLMIALANKLLEVGRFPFASSMKRCLDLLASNRTRIPIPDRSYDDTTISAIMSFIEACAARNLSKTKIMRVLNHYVPVRASRFVSSDHNKIERDTYLRAIALRCVISEGFEVNLDELLPKEFVTKEKNHRQEQDLREFKEIVGGLLPWYKIRARILINDINDISEALKNTDQQSNSAQGQRYRDYDIIPYEISRIYVEILKLYHRATALQVDNFFAEYLKENDHIQIHDRLNTVRIAYRLEHLSGLKNQLEQAACEVVASASNEGPETRAEWFIDLARAVLPVSPDDAAAYFNYAIEVVSKFGDEIGDRWKAVTVLANRSAEGEPTNPEMAYRFIRCAELIGDNVVREKYWSRDEAIRICTRLSPVSALAALSRWRDRGVGWFEQQLPALAKEMVYSKYLPPLVGWSLSSFFDGYELDDFAFLCIEREASIIGRQYILDSAVRDLSISEITENSWNKLKQVSDQYSTENRILKNIVDYYDRNPDKLFEKSNNRPTHGHERKETKPCYSDNIFIDLDLTSSYGIGQAIQRFEKTATIPRDPEAFWHDVFSRIDEQDAVIFLRSLVDAENADMYDIRRALSCMPTNWQCKASVKRNWAKILEQITYRFASQFINHDSLEYFLKYIPKIDFDEAPNIQGSILEGLSNNSELADANTFFGFAEIAAILISPHQSTDLLDFALARFEVHIDENYADGRWFSWLTPPEDISMAFTGFVWAALGSPRSEIRWRAVHCVRRLYEANCALEIDAIIAWMRLDDDCAFGSHVFVFYNLHARLYLLIALARVSVDNPHILTRHHDIFSFYALESIPHVLIQKYSAEIALNIEKASPDTYSSDVVERLYRVGTSQLPVREMKRYGERLESYWHKRGEIDKSKKFHHGYDFDRYWFEPLGRVFGVSGKQVEELATEVILNEWKIKNDGSYVNDSRQKLWRRYDRNGRETWHSHFSYPRTDNYSFYLSYHSMLVVAAKLLNKMPVVHSEDWPEDDWAEWLNHHLITRNDGCWLADRRDPAPLEQRKWINDNKDENWRKEIWPTDFLDGILIERNGETWLNVFGSWEDGDNERKEDYYVSSALVLPESSQSLLHALTNCSNPYDFKLPDYQEEDMEIELYPFMLKGWIWRNDTSKRLDEFDPFAGQIYYPPYQIGKSIIEQLKLTADSELREWYMDNQGEPCLLCEIWSSNKSSINDERLRQGIKLSASLEFLKKLCQITDCELILEVQINRGFRNNHYRSNDDEEEYKPPYSKVYILSADGELRDEKTNYKLR